MVVGQVRPADAEPIAAGVPYRVADEVGAKQALLADVRVLTVQSQSRAARHAAGEMLRALLVSYRDRPDCPGLVENSLPTRPPASRLRIRRLGVRIPSGAQHHQDFDLR